ncbi:MAG: hypothetical protein E6Q88_05085 [Lysobacteraceae bacterium]|nr:MAG: hypothetical protein E6Q88_05085 [Xanthomonadaceae bacterium]
MTKPSEFYVGVLDLFAVLLPGAIATAILEPRFGYLLQEVLFARPYGEIAGWGFFLAVSYFLGHLVFLVGSYIDGVYNALRERLNPYGNESAYQCATNIRDSLIDASERKALNTFQWARAVLIAKCPDAAQDVHRLEADSKFFRSLLVISALAAIVFFADGAIGAGVVAVLLMAPCFARYYERRLKSTTQAYLHIIALHRLDMLRPHDSRCE